MIFVIMSVKASELTLISESDRTSWDICDNVCQGFRTDINISESLIERAGIFVIMSVKASELTLISQRV